MSRQAFVLSAVLLISNHLYSFLWYKNLGISSMLWWMILTLGILCLLLVRNQSRLIHKNMIYFFGGVICLSFITSYIFEKQSFFSSILATRMFLGLLLFYFVLHYLKVTENTIIMVLTYLSFVYIGVVIFQQISDVQYFGMRTGNFIRMGLKRYFVLGDRLCIIPMCYFIDSWIKKRKTKFFIISLVLLLGLLITTERMLMFSAISTFFIATVCLTFKSKKNIITYLVPIALVGGWVYSVLPLSKLECNLVEKTINQFEENKSEDDIRLVAINYYLNEFNDSQAKLLFGTGIPGGGSEYETNINAIEEYNGLYRIDIGIFGDISTHGLITVIFLLFLMIILLWSSILPQYLKFTIIFFILSWALNSSIDTTYRFVLWPIIIYLFDIKELESQTTNHLVQCNELQ